MSPSSEGEGAKSTSEGGAKTAKQQTTKKSTDSGKKSGLDKDGDGNVMDDIVTGRFITDRNKNDE